VKRGEAWALLVVAFVAIVWIMHLIEQRGR
jgi:hypothetical protein